MSRNRCPEGQHHLFSPDTCPAQQAKAAAPLPPLPFESEKSVDIGRACNILGTNRTTVIRLMRRGLICGFPIHHSRRTSQKLYRIEYASLLAYCDRLRAKYHLMSRPPRPAGMRPRDSDVLPFPMADTISLAEVIEHLDVTRLTAVKLLDTGEISGYKLIEGAGSDWRVRRSSFVRYLEGLRGEAKKPIHASCTI